MLGGLEADSEYHLAWFSDQMVACGMLASCSTDRDKAFGARGLETSYSHVLPT